jgi:hypothetical protein
MRLRDNNPTVTHIKMPPAREGNADSPRRENDGAAGQKPSTNTILSKGE